MATATADNVNTRLGNMLKVVTEVGFQGPNRDVLGSAVLTFDRVSSNGSAHTVPKFKRLIKFILNDSQ